jgi:pantetheine-phosphate adenylyltransferase
MPRDYGHALYAGSFDPITLGHTAIIERALKIYPRVTVAIGVNPNKRGLFTLDERRALIEASVDRKRVEIVSFTGLVVDLARNIDAGVLLRGLRLLTDFEHEFQLALGNRDLAPEIETVFMMTASEYVYVSSSLVKEIAMNGGDSSKYVPPAVQAQLEAKFPRK